MRQMGNPYLETPSTFFYQTELRYEFQEEETKILIKLTKN
jgi:hypothetical protein